MDNPLENLCPICQRPNDPGAERCWYCQAVLSEKKEKNSDWLNDLREESEPEEIPQSEAENEAQLEEEKPEEIPDWLARIRTRELMERENQPLEEEKQASDNAEREDLPEWLKEIKAGKSGTNAKEDEVASQNAVFEEKPAEEFSSLTIQNPEQADSQDDEETQEWLEKLAAWQPANEDNKNDTPESFINPEPKFNKSDQYRGFEENAQQPTEGEEEKGPFETTDAAELDPAQGWQRIFLEETEPEAPEIASQGRPSSATTEARPSVEINASDQAKPVEDGSTVSQNLQSAPFIDESESTAIPAETQESSTGEKTEGSDTDAADQPPFMEDDLPEWLSTARLNEVKADTARSTESLEPAPPRDKETPDTRTADREPPSPTKPEAFTEMDETSTQLTGGIGLLAGINGVLHPVTTTQDFRKPAAYGSALKVTDHQKKNASLFASLVEDTFIDETEEVRPKTGKSLRILFQLLLGGILVAIMIFGKTNLAAYAVTPVLFPPEVVAVFDQVNALPADKPVLVIADFEAASFGELSWSSQTLMEHLLRRDLSLVLVSGTPAGTTMLVEHLNEVSQKIPSYNLKDHLINLGYLAGGSTGLQFLSGDIQSALPYTNEFEEAWRSPALATVETLNDFGGVIILSDNAEHARFWVEQIEPGLDKIPLMFVCSAQAAPLIQPYYQSGQVTGFIAGFNGSLSYEKVFMQPSQATANLISFQAAVLFVALIILIGGFIALLRPDPSNRKVDRNEP